MTIWIHKQSPTDNCTTCAHAVSPRENYGICMRTHRYISETLSKGDSCGDTFFGWVQKRRWWLLWLA